MATVRDRLTRPPGDLIDAAARRSRSSMRERVDRLLGTWLTVAQCAVGAGLAWLAATQIAGHAHPFFAPIAAILTLGLTYGQRWRRAVELSAGVAIGIGIADLIVLGIGTGAWQIVIVVALAMSAAVLVGGGPLFVNQCAVSAVLVATLQGPNTSFSGARFVDALIGGAVGLLITAVIPTDPLRIVRREAEPLLEELAEVLDDVAAALQDRDPEAAKAALRRGRAMDPASARLREAISTGHEVTTFSLAPRRARGPLDAYSVAYEQIDLAVRNSRVLARGAIRATELGERVPPHAIDAVRDLAAAVRALPGELAGSSPSGRVGDAALRAAARSTAALEETGNLSASVIVGQIRSTAVDLLRSLGMSGDEARAAVRDARARLGV
ncbi:FUSC family protein [Capillimicrobium parvum]|uniref:Integral membrane bound transporter domain-containing protein n=1 Tax=Capillimicrobium parvum TaxID=2884022 RepID=A0A9E7C5L6_9ACTN|nr:FUSC family protein [Capillimicrobium parvum]UGS38473.1 hypothetical protein DSM104329_04902 [Capillimicrobium parvum]